MIGKCRVAPIRHSMIPKLELQAAVYGGRPRRQILRVNDVKIDKNYHRTVCSIVLRWLKAANKKQQLFVAIRTAEILEKSSMDKRRLVKGLDNGADIRTRRMSIKEFKKSG